MSQTALIFGSSGLVGSHVLQQLLINNNFSVVHVFVRRSTGIVHPKIKEHVINFDLPESYSPQIKGDALFCCLGTTIGKAGSQEAFRKVDFDFPVTLARIAALNKVKKFSVISSLGANANSSNFYLRTKGEMEKEIQKNIFQHLSILRPSMLLGKRPEFRLGELIGKAAMRVLSPLMMGKYKKYRGIEAHTVAKAMIKIVEKSPDKIIFESDELQQLGI